MNAKKEEKIDWMGYHRISSRLWGISYKEVRKSQYWNVVVVSCLGDRPGIRESFYISFAYNIITGEEVIEIIPNDRMKDYHHAMPGRERGYNVIVKDKEHLLTIFLDYPHIQNKFITHKWSSPKFTKLPLQK